MPLLIKANLIFSSKISLIVNVLLRTSTDKISTVFTFREGNVISNRKIYIIAFPRPKPSWGIVFLPHDSSWYSK